MTAARAQTTGVIGLGAMGWPMPGHRHRAGRDFSTEKSMVKIVARTFDTGFSLGLFAKDVKIAADLAQAECYPSPISRTVSEWMAEAHDALGGEHNHTLAYTYRDAKRIRS